MDQPILAYTLWLSYSQEQRNKLVRLFEIPRTGEVVVHVGEMMNGNIGATAKQDGHRPEDLGAITVEKLQTLIGTEDTDFYHMVQHVMDNLNDLYYEKFPEDRPQETEAIESVPVPTPPEPAPETEFVPRDPEELIKKSPEDVGVIAEISDMSEKEIQEGMVTVIKSETKTKPHAKTKATKAK